MALYNQPAAAGVTPPAGDIGGTTGSPTVVATHLSAALPVNQGGTASTTRNWAGLLTPTAVKTTTYTAAAGDFVPCDTTSAGFTVTLPAAPADLSVVAAKMVIQGGTNTVTIAAGGSDVFNAAGGTTTRTLTLASQAILLQYKATGAIWYVIADDLPLSQLDSRYLAQSSLPLAIGSGGTGAASTSQNFAFIGPTSGSGAPSFRAIVAGDLAAAAGTTGVKGALQLDGTAGDIQVAGNPAAGSTGLAADAGHVHPATGFTPADTGYLAWTFDPATTNTSKAPGGGSVILARVNVRGPVSCTNVVLAVVTAGSGLTASQNFAGLYSSAGTLIGSTADQSAVWTTPGLYAQPLAGGPYALTAGFYWVAFVANGSTIPAFLAGNINSAAAANAGFTVSTARGAFTGASVHTLASITPSSNTLYSTLWAAIS